LIREIGLSRNNDSPTLPSGFDYCSEGLDIRVFTQPGPTTDIMADLVQTVIIDLDSCRHLLG
jgi:hypothetical protein